MSGYHENTCSSSHWSKSEHCGIEYCGTITSKTFLCFIGVI